MVNDPYSVLGVSKNATPEEIKKAYRQKARQYHPDMHPDDPTANQKMNEINEAYDMLTNPDKYAKRTAQSSSSGQSYGGYSSSSYGSSGYSSGSSNNYNGYNSSYGGQNGWSSNFYGFSFEDLFGAFSGANQSVNLNPKEEAGDSQEFRTAISYINSGRYSEAIKILATVVSSGRNARWYYLSSIAYYGMKDMTRAVDHIQRASQLNPNNQQYQMIYRQFVRSSQTYQSSEAYGESSSGSGYTTRTRRGGLLSLFFPIIIFYLIIQLMFGGGCLGCYGRSYYNNTGSSSGYSQTQDVNGRK